jgi:hypothetical protein
MRHLGRCEKVEREIGVTGMGGFTVETVEQWNRGFECPIRRCRQTHGDLPQGTQVCPRCGEAVG